MSFFLPNADLTPRGKAGNPFKVSQNSSASKTGAKGTGYFETLESQHSYKTKQGKTSFLDTYIIIIIITKNGVCMRKYFCIKIILNLFIVQRM